MKDKIQVLFGDILGALNATIITLPQALAFGVATGLGANAGIWGAIILTFIAGITGVKVPIISGITGPIAIVIASMMHALEKNISSIIFIIFLAGILQILLSLTKLPSIIKYVPYPVISGFMNGIGTIIIIMQLNALIGIPTCSNTIESIKSIFFDISNININALILGLLTLLIVFLFPKKISKFIPAQIIALVLCTLISINMEMQVERISVISTIIPEISIPTTNLHDFITYFHYAITLAVILSSESLLTGLVTTSITKTQISPKRLLISQGIGNLFCSITGTLPGSAATMRTVAAIKGGASTKFCAITTSILLILLTVKFSNFVSQIPLAVLAGILIKIGYDIIDTKFLKVIKLAPKDDLWVLSVVFILTVFYNLIVAVGAGITLAALLYAKKVADNAKITTNSIYDKDIIKLEKSVERDYSHKIRVVHINGSLFFGSATQLISHFDEMLGTRYLILVYDSDETLDISAIFALEDIILRLKSQHIKILFVIKNGTILEQLRKYKIVSQLGEHRIFLSELEAIEHAKTLLKKRVHIKYFRKKDR